VNDSLPHGKARLAAVSRGRAGQTLAGRGIGMGCLQRGASGDGRTPVETPLGRARQGWPRQPSVGCGMPWQGRVGQGLFTAGSFARGVLRWSSARNGGRGPARHRMAWPGWARLGKGYFVAVSLRVHRCVKHRSAGRSRAWQCLVCQGTGGRGMELLRSRQRAIADGCVKHHTAVHGSARRGLAGRGTARAQMGNQPRSDTCDN
jgi:hypothetical protein